MYENNSYNYGNDFYDEYTNSKLKESSKVFSRIFLAVFFFILAANITAILVETVMVLALGKEEAVNIINKSEIYPWLLNALPQYLVAFPIFHFIVKGMKRTDRIKSKLPISEFLSLLLVAEVALVIGDMLGDTVTEFFSMFKGEAITNPIDDLLSGTPIWIVILFGVVIAPIFEEIIFRKLIINRLSIFGDGLAVIVSAVTFGLFHGNFNQLFYAISLGLVLGFVYARTRDVKYSIIMHALINLVGSVVPMLFAKPLARFYDMLEKISKQIEVDVSVYMQDFMVLGSYLVIYLVAFGAGISILFKWIKRKKFRLNSVYDYKIPKERVAGTIFLNVGAILLLTLTAISLVLNIIF